MHVECSYCGARLADKEPLGDLRTSHGTCDGCWDAKVLPETLKAILPDSIDPATPVLVVNGDGRIVGANGAAEQMTGRVPRDLGLLGGDYMGCMFALVEGGCGKTSHCDTCTIRLAVMATLGGNPCEQLPVFLRREDQYLKLIISTKADQGLVQVTVHRVAPAEP